MIEGSGSAATVHAAAAALRDLASRLAVHGLGDRWEGPARRACELQVRALEEALRSHARQLDALAVSHTPTSW